MITEDKWHPCSEVYGIMSRMTGTQPPMVSVPKYLARALVYPVHLVNVAAGNWRFMWDPKTVDAVTTERAYSIEKARKELSYFPRYSLGEGSERDRALVQAERNSTVAPEREASLTFKDPNRLGPACNDYLNTAGGVDEIGIGYKTDPDTSVCINYLFRSCYVAR